MATLYTYCIHKIKPHQYPHIEFIDTTVKAHHPDFAPTWAMVKAYKEGTLSEEAYTQQYITLMKARYADNKTPWYAVLRASEVALGCYCHPGKFCHRHLLADLFQRLATHQGYPLTLKGELSPPLG